MDEQQFEQELKDVKRELHVIAKNTNAPLWRSFVTGTLSGLGSVVGVAIALTIIGWVLNVVGVIPAFKNEVNKIESSLSQIRGK